MRTRKNEVIGFICFAPCWRCRDGHLWERGGEERLLLAPRWSLWLFRRTCRVLRWNAIADVRL